MSNISSIETNFGYILDKRSSTRVMSETVCDTIASNDTSVPRRCWNQSFRLFCWWVTKQGLGAGHYAATGPGCLHTYCTNKAARSYRTSCPHLLLEANNVHTADVRPDLKKGCANTDERAIFAPIDQYPLDRRSEWGKKNTTLHLFAMRHHHKTWFSPEKWQLRWEMSAHAYTFGFSRLAGIIFPL